VERLGLIQPLAHGAVVMVVVVVVVMGHRQQQEQQIQVAGVGVATGTEQMAHRAVPESSLSAININLATPPARNNYGALC
jgi:hypothetical protein